MSISVSCPNGHKIACNEGMIGRNIKCPACESAFRVPDPKAAASSEPEEPATADGNPGQNDMIEFLCPNGHKLSGPASLQGKAGKCPHCGSRFLIPDYSEEESEDDADAPLDRGGQAGGDLPPLDDLPQLDELSADAEVEDLPAARNPIEVRPVEASDRDDPFSFIDGSGGADSAASKNASPATVESPVLTVVGAHPMAQLFESLWSRRSFERGVQLLLASGEKLSPDHYASGLSRQCHGVFASRQDDGTYSIIAVNWDAVQQVTLLRVPDLPTDLFPQ